MAGFDVQAGEAWSMQLYGSVMSCSLVQTHQCFRGKYHIHLQGGNPEDAGSRFL
jgi:hypothetical protein